MENTTTISLRPTNDSYSDNTRITDYHKFMESETFRTLFALLFSLILFFTVLGGIFACYVIRQHKLGKKLIWQYLFIMAISDTAVTVLSIPVIIAACYDERLLNIHWLCVFNGFTMSFFFTWSAVTLIAVSRQKYILVARPFKATLTHRSLDFVVYFIVALSSAFFISTAPLFGLSRYTHWGGLKWTTTISDNARNDLTYALVWTVIHFIVPLCTTSIYSGRVFLIVKRQTNERMKMRGTSSFLAEQRSIVAVISTIILGYIILKTPNVVVMMFGMFRYSVPIWYSHLSFVFMFSQGVFNIVVYCCRYSLFGRELRNIFHLKQKEYVKKTPVVEKRLRASTLEYLRPTHIRVRSETIPP